MLTNILYFWLCLDITNLCIDYPGESISIRLYFAKSKGSLKRLQDTESIRTQVKSMRNSFDGPNWCTVKYGKSSCSISMAIAIQAF